MRINRAHIAFAHDVVMAMLSFFVSLFLRLGDDVFFYDTSVLWLSAGVFTVVAGSVFWSMKMYRGVWRYASLNDLLTITKSVSLTVLVFLIIMFATTRLEALPRSLPFINWFVLIALLGGSRFIYRLFKDRKFDLTFHQANDQRVPVLLAGAGDEAEMFIRAMSRPDSAYNVTAIIARMPGRVGRDIHNVEVLGTIDQMAEVVEKLRKSGRAPERLIVSDASFDGDQLRTMLEQATELDMDLARLPVLTDFRQGIDSEIEVQPIDVEDLLGRPEKSLDRAPVEALIKNRRILITGAGGSIGAELVRQVAALAPSDIILLDISEYNLFSIDKDVSREYPEIPRRAVIADVRDRGRVDNLFDLYRPEVVFHAAALKHVPLVEANIVEGMATNVLGTVNIADACRATGTAMLVQISTDKAVNPTSVMGASKRVAEMYCQALETERSTETTRIVTVRFGNVLGSTGSVVELFREQLARGGPLTVTHPDMKRYFMTIREAVELVLQAAALGGRTDEHDGRIFVLDMGEPVLIVDLAEQMIRLAGYAPNEDVAIEIVGRRPGEKLFEEIFHGAEPLVATACEGLLTAAPRTVPLREVAAEIETVTAAYRTSDSVAAMEVIARLVPEYCGDSEAENTASAAE